MVLGVGRYKCKWSGMDEDGRAYDSDDDSWEPTDSLGMSAEDESEWDDAVDDMSFATVDLLTALAASPDFRFRVLWLEDDGTVSDWYEGVCLGPTRNAGGFSAKFRADDGEEVWVSEGTLVHANLVQVGDSWYPKRTRV
eukprot:COSAG02_NODE_1449_length_12567_cov_4.622474_7_plen_139_part_00